MTTPELVSRARDGEREAFELLFHRFHDEVYRFATRRLGDATLGQDVAAETMADAFRSIHRFQFRGAPFEAWLYTIARRKLADVRRAPSRRESPVEQIADTGVADASGNLLDAMQVRELLDKLSDSDREIIELRFMEDLDVEQTAKRIGKSEGAVRVAQHRALNKLREMLNEGAA